MPETKKILLLLNALDVGGVEKDIIRNFPHINKEKNLQITLCLYHRAGALYNDNLAQKLSIIINPKSHHGLPRIINNWLYIRKMIKQRKPDIIHSFLPEGYFFGLLALRSLFFKRGQTPRFVMSRVSLNYYMQKHKILGFVERHILHNLGVARFVGNSKAVCTQLQEEGIGPEKITLLYNGINLADFYTPRKIANKNKTLQLLAVGNLHLYKGYETLIQAASRLKHDEQLDFVIRIAGRDEAGNLAKYQALLKKLTLSDNVIFLGNVDNVAALLGETDMFIHPSYTEGLPNGIIEAMASGLPVIASKVGGIPELVQEGHSGYLCPPKDAEALAKSIASLAKDSQKIYDMGQYGLFYVKDNFALDKSLKSYIELYQNL